jgi:FixJ family two-component response regulator
LSDERSPVTEPNYIAVVDDDESVREAVTNLFRSMGLTAYPFASAEEFLSSGALEHACCLVLDVQMPGMGGLNLQTHLASIGKGIPIVFVTADHDEAMRHRALQSGAVCFLTKPVDEGDLLEGLHSALPSSREDV